MEKKSHHRPQISDSTYRAIFENSSASIAILERSFTISMVNDAFCLLSGYQRDELLGSKWTDKMPPHEVDRLKAFNKMRMMGDLSVPQQYESSFYTQDNQVRYILVSASLIGEEKRTIVTLVDITEKKVAEAKLQESEERFRSMIEHTNDMVYSLSSDGIFTYVSPNFKEQLGYELEEVLGNSFHPIVHPDDLERLKEIVIRHFTTGCKFTGLDYRVKHKDGSIRWHSSSTATVKTPEGRVTSVVGIARDITRNKEIEEAILNHQIQLNNALKIAHLGSWEYETREGKFHFNDTFYAIYKSTAGDVNGYRMTVAEYVDRFVHPEDRHLVGESLQRALETTSPSYTDHIEHRILYADGEEGIIAVRISVLMDQNGKVHKLFGINQDITSFKKAQDELKRSEAQLRELNSMKDKFFSIIAHDLKSPFNAIMGFSELMAEEVKENDTSNIEDFSDAILSSSKKAMNLLENLMKWCQAETGNIKCSPKELALCTVMDEVIELFSPIAANKSISLKSEIPPDFRAYADAQMLKTILRNLVSNAIKFTPRGGHIAITAEENEGANLIQVTDSGIGISPESIPNLFRIDRAVSNLGTEQEEGTGLGLILCKEFVDKHGGSIGVKSEEGKGTSFYFSLPKSTELMTH